MTGETIRVLLIEEDSPEADRALKALAEAGDQFEVRRATRLEEAIQTLEREPCDAVLTGLSLPDSDGLETLASLRRRAARVPVVALATAEGERTETGALRHGAQEVLFRENLTADSLARAIRHAIERQRSLNEIHRLLSQVQTGKELLERKNRRMARLYETAETFVQNISNEFRLPLVAIMDFAASLAGGGAGPMRNQQRRMLRAIVDRADDLARMVDDLLDSGRLEAGMFRVRRRAISLSQVYDRVLGELTEKAKTKGLSVRADFEPGLPNVYADPEAASRVLVNLTSNAFKLCGPDGQVRLWTKWDGRSSEVVCGVSEDGPGLEYETLKAIVARLRDIGGESGDNTKACSLGLNIAKELVDLCLGRMNAESRPGQGSTFWFTLPVADPVEVMKKYVARVQWLRNGSPVVTLLTARIPEGGDDALADETDHFLNELLRRNDLLFRTGRRRWLLSLAVDESELDRFLQRADEAREHANRRRGESPLPRIALTPCGAWPVIEQGADMLARFEALLAEPDAIPEAEPELALAK